MGQERNLTLARFIGSVESVNIVLKGRSSEVATAADAQLNNLVVASRIP